MYVRYIHTYTVYYVYIYTYLYCIFMYIYIYTVYLCIYILYIYVYIYCILCIYIYRYIYMYCSEATQPLQSAPWLILQASANSDSDSNRVLPRSGRSKVECRQRWPLCHPQTRNEHKKLGEHHCTICFLMARDGKGISPINAGFRRIINGGFSNV